MYIISATLMEMEDGDGEDQLVVKLAEQRLGLVVN